MAVITITHPGFVLLPPVAKKAFFGGRFRPRTTPATNLPMGWALPAQNESMTATNSTRLYVESVIAPKKLDTLHFYNEPSSSGDWAAGAYSPYSGMTLDTVSAAGIIPVIGQSYRWTGAWGQIGDTTQHDAQIDALATKLAAVVNNPKFASATIKNPVVLVGPHEFQTPAYVFGTADEYIGMFRKLAQRIRAIAPNVAIAWCQQAASYKSGGAIATSCYPGDDCIDWILADGYPMNNERGTQPRPSADPMKGIFQGMIDWDGQNHVQAGTHGGNGHTAGARPLGTGEWATGDFTATVWPHNKAEWYDQSTTQINDPAWDKIQMYTTFNSNAYASDSTPTNVKLDHWMFDGGDGSNPNGCRERFAALANSPRFNLTVASTNKIAAGDNGVLVSAAISAGVLYVTDGTLLVPATSIAPQTVSVTLQNLTTVVFQYTGVSGNTATGLSLYSGLSTGTLHTNDVVVNSGAPRAAQSSGWRTGAFLSF